jgi:hypothetical protein
MSYEIEEKFLLSDVVDEDGRVGTLCVVKSLQLVPRADEAVPLERFRGTRVWLELNRRWRVVEADVSDLMWPYPLLGAGNVPAPFSMHSGDVFDVRFEDPYAARALQVEFEGHVLERENGKQKFARKI